MDFLTTNFVFEDISSRFDGKFRLLDLPLEILFKILIFLDDPDLQTLGRTCRYLKMVANERFISRSKFLYAKRKLGISLQLSPTTQDLYRRNILPSPTKDTLTNFNINYFELANSLQKSFCRDTLSKRLKQRPTKQELRTRNIIPDKEMSQFVREKLKDFKKENLSQVFGILIDSYKFQKHKDLSRDYKGLEEVNKQILFGLEDVSDDFTQVYLRFFKRLGRHLTFSEKKSKDFVISTQKSVSATFSKINYPLNHIENSFSCSSDAFNLNRKENLVEENTKIADVEVSNVQTRKEFFENLAITNSSLGLAGNHLPVNRSSDSSDIKKHPKMLLKASVINDNVINYEKIY